MIPRTARPFPSIREKTENPAMTSPRIIANGPMIFFQTGPDDSAVFFFDFFDVPDFFGRLRAGAGAGSSS
ncbi:MAG: hypothetical protein ACI92S_002229 [Planctomycetaceae bacterium]|jgi:hypothetical protein